MIFWMSFHCKFYNSWRKLIYLSFVPLILKPGSPNSRFQYFYSLKQLWRNRMTYCIYTNIIKTIGTVCFLKVFLAYREVDFQIVINNNFLRIIVDPENFIGMAQVGSWQDWKYMLSTSLAKISFIVGLWILDFKVLQKAVFVFKQT